MSGSIFIQCRKTALTLRSEKLRAFPSTNLTVGSGLLLQKREPIVTGSLNSDFMSFM
jgi:hypothetical protein